MSAKAFFHCVVWSTSIVCGYSANAQGSGVDLVSGVPVVYEAITSLTDPASENYINIDELLHIAQRNIAIAAQYNDGLSPAERFEQINARFNNPSAFPQETLNKEEAEKQIEQEVEGVVFAYQTTQKFARAFGLKQSGFEAAQNNIFGLDARNPEKMKAQMIWWRKMEMGLLDEPKNAPIAQPTNQYESDENQPELVYENYDGTPFDPNAKNSK